MFSEVFTFLINIIFSLFGVALLLRAWAYATRLHPFNPISQTLFKVTDWLVLPLRKIVKNSMRLDWPSLLGAYLAALLYTLLIFIVQSGLAHLTVLFSLLPQLLLLALVYVVRWALSLVLWVILGQAILSWVNPGAPFMPVLRTLTEPLLAPVRRVLPNLGALDLSPLAIIILTQLATIVLNNISMRLIGM
ncbi:YggT family protein [Alcaligenes endophyticus]|uniref:YggT family protein n=1 Tax=Alcaligenes endophyticus TaxID=1929088 RepID=A0ABT8EM15_9BURK|nr:YggT family protein [Alcaligenes endophyticus]MCX5591076.1 YggT family protein [Alcaligenes endophyticus]MDN4122346.1 YggT family protein [Alcaligenes endophyticus]